MKRLGTSNTCSYYQNFWENFRAEVGESSKKPKKSAKACNKQAHRENVRSFCAICDAMAKNMMGSIEPEKREVVVENNVVENGEVVHEDEKGEVVLKNVVQNGEVVGEEMGEEGGKVVIIDHRIEFEALGDGENNAAGEGGEGDVVEEKNDEDMFSSDIFGECDLLSGWEELKFEVEQRWECSDPFWEIGDIGAYNFWNVEAPAAIDWAESLWQF